MIGGPHPGPAELCAAKVEQLEEALNDPAIREEANGLLRSLIDRVELAPAVEGATAATLYGDLAQILAVCEGLRAKKNAPRREPGAFCRWLRGRDHTYTDTEHAWPGLDSQMRLSVNHGSLNRRAQSRLLCAHLGRSRAVFYCSKADVEPSDLTGHERA